MLEKRRYIKLLRELNIDGMDYLLNYLNVNGFFEMPASTKYHGSYDGGLLEHSLNVYQDFSEKIADLSFFSDKLGEIDERTIVLCSLLHDLCKTGAYIKQKDDTYIFNKEHLKGHALLSLDIIEKHIKLLPIEKTLIKFHMGYYGTYEFSSRGEYSLKELSEAQNNPLVKLFHWCDDYCAQFVDE